MHRSAIRIISIFFNVFLIAGFITTTVSAQSSPSLTVHDIQAAPRTDEFAYDVSVFFSLYDSSGEPVRDLAIADVSLTEDGKRVDPTGLENADQAPINVAIVMDTSGSMSGVKMDAARQAAARFISSLGSDDQAALISFNSDITTEIAFTDNLPAVREKVELLDAVDNAGTCFFDALYEAVQISAGIPSGRRAIVVLTDGRDELPDATPCSKFTDQDVIDLATSETTGVPIYTLGLGNRVDAQGLERLAARTGGLYQFATDPSALEAVFAKLSDQLRSQYLLSYVSIAAPGPHVLALQVDTSSIHEQTSHNFVLSSFPYRLAFVSPQEGQELSGESTLSVQVSGQGEPIARVEFFLNGQSLGSDSEPAYELTWTPEQSASGARLEAVAYGEAGGELARTTIDVDVSAPADPLPTEIPATEVPAATPRNLVAPALAIGGVAVAMVAIILVVVLVSVRNRRREQQRDAEWRAKVQTESPPVPSLGEERTLDSFTPSENALGMLVVLQSDDPVMIGQRIEISRPVTNLGRKADNDVIFAKDSPVSRHHAVIEERDGSLFLSEVIALDDGTPKRPAYGTFVDGEQIGDPVLLKDGAEIHLGKRVRLRFEGVQRTTYDTDKTTDQLNSGDERTMDSFGK